MDDIQARERDRVRLIRHTDPRSPLQPGTLGTVGHIDATGTVHVNWDNGSRLGIVAAAGDVIEVVERYDPPPAYTPTPQAVLADDLAEAVARARLAGLTVEGIRTVFDGVLAVLPDRPPSIHEQAQRAMGGGDV